MRTDSLIIGAILLSLGTLSLVTIFKNWEDPDQEFRAEFEVFRRTHTRDYRSLAESAFRLSVFQQNYRFILAHNAKGLSYELGLNQFADLTFEEFSARFLSPISDYLFKGFEISIPKAAVDDAPLLEEPEIDWRRRGVIRPPRVTGGLYSSAHAVTSTIEASLSIARHEPLPYLSCQELCDCTASQSDAKFMWRIFDYVRRCGVNTDAAYPMAGSRMVCHPPATLGPYKIDGFEEVGDGPTDLIRVLKRQPTTSALAVGPDFQFYKGGIFNPLSCAPKINLAVSVVGYRLDEEHPQFSYYIGKNCWGEGWGENGFFRIAVSSKPEGTCGFTTKGFMYTALVGQ